MIRLFVFICIITIFYFFIIIYAKKRFNKTKKKITKNRCKFFKNKAESTQKPTSSFEVQD